MKILHIVREAYPIINGYTIRTSNIIEKITTHKITVVGSIIGRKYFDTYSLITKKNNITYINLLNRTWGKIIRGVEHIPKFRLFFHYLLIPINALLIIKKINIKDYDIIHGHSTFMNGLSALIVAKLYGKIFIYDIHALSIDSYIKKNIRYYFEKKITSILINKSDAIIVIDKALKKNVVNLFCVNSKKIFVAENGVNTELFKPLNINKSIDCFTIGIDDSKKLENFKFIKYNIHKITEKIPDVKFLVFDSNGNNLNDKRFKYLKNIDFDLMPKYYNMTNLFVFPRIKNKQTDTVTPLKILEVMSCGVVPLVSDVKGLSTCVEKAKSGFVYQSDNIEDFCEKLLIIRDLKISEYLKISQNCRKWVIANKSWKKTAEVYEKVYRNI